MRLNVALFAGLTSSVLAVPTQYQEFQQFSPEDIIERDVAIIGGGAAGTYAALRLGDQGKSFVVIEKQDHLGGHVNTYSPPGSPFGIDYGVIAYLELPGVRELFARFNISLFPAPNPGFQRQYIDFATGQPVASGVIAAQANQSAVQAALATYGQLAAKYVNYTFPSLVQLPTGAALPEDLALPFGDFVAKYRLEAAVPTIWGFVNYAGDVLRESTAYILSQYGAVHLNATANGGLLLADTLNNSVLYDRALHALGANVLLSSTVAVADRSDAGATLVVAGADGCSRKLVKAKKLLVTIPPLVDALAPLGLDETETAVFSQWKYQSAYVGVLAQTGLPDGLDLVNAVPDAAPAVLNLPGAGGASYVWNFISSGFPGLYRTNVIGSPDLSADQAKGLVSDAAAKLKAVYKNATEPVWAAFASHTPLQLRATVEGTSQGFYQQAFGMNGRRSTFYAGAAWASDYTSVHWTYLESVILPMILKGLQ